MLNTSPTLKRLSLSSGALASSCLSLLFQAWLLKLPRIVLQPREPSMYGRLRNEPRRDFVSTLEAIADTLPALGESEQLRSSLRRLLRTLLQRARDAGQPLTTDDISTRLGSDTP